MRHPDEGVIQGWVEGQLPAAEAAEVGSHVAGCAECQGLVAEIRGLMARTSGIVAALDGEAGVRPAIVPAAAMEPARPAHSVRPARGRGRGRGQVALRRWVPALAAAVVVAAVMRQASSDVEGRDEVREALRGESAVHAPGVSTAPVGAPAPMPAPAQAPTPARASAPVPAPVPAPAPTTVAPPPSSARAMLAPGAAVAAPMRAPVAAPMRAPAAAPAAPPVPPAAAEQVAVGSGGAGADSSRAGMAGGVSGVVGRVARNAEPRVAAQARAEDAAMKARRSAPEAGMLYGATNQPVIGCYRVISGTASQILLDSAGAASVAGAGTTPGRWRLVGDSVVVRWRDSVAVFPAGAERTSGRVGVVGGESRPLTLRLGCPAP